METPFFGEGEVFGEYDIYISFKFSQTPINIYY